MQDITPEEELCYRYGGEEFVILLTDQDIKEAFTLAERLRIKLAETLSPSPSTDYYFFRNFYLSRRTRSRSTRCNWESGYIKYQSKNEGRNRTTVYQ